MHIFHQWEQWGKKIFGGDCWYQESRCLECGKIKTRTI